MSWLCPPVNGGLQPMTNGLSRGGLQFEGFSGSGSSQWDPFVPVFSAFGVAAAPDDGLATGLGAFVLTGGEGPQLLTSMVKIKINIPIDRTRFMAARSFAVSGSRVVS